MSGDGQFFNVGDRIRCVDEKNYLVPELAYDAIYVVSVVDRKRRVIKVQGINEWLAM